jgi:hypothetical protein
MKQKTYQINTRVTEVEADIVRQLAEREFEGNTSQAVRKIIRDWPELEELKQKSGRTHNGHEGN